MRLIVLFTLLALPFYSAAQKSYIRTLTVQDPCEGNGIPGHNPGQISVFPNPNNGWISFQLPEEGSAVLYDVRGASVMSAKVFISNRWDVSTLPAGIYFLEVSSGNSVLRTRLMIQ